MKNYKQTADSCIMKRIFVVMIVLFMTVSSFAQKVKIDRVETSGVRLIETTIKSVGGPALANYIGIALSAVSSGDSVAWYVNLKVDESKPITFGSALLIKLQDDSVITLTSVSDAVGTSSAIPLNFGNGLMMNVSIHTAYAKYPVPYKDLQRMMNTEVVKIRVETPDKVYDRQIKGKITKHVATMYRLITERLKTNNSRSIYDDF